MEQARGPAGGKAEPAAAGGRGDGLRRGWVTIEVVSSRRAEGCDITARVTEVVRSSGVTTGVCYVFCPHTTAGVCLNENADPSVIADVTGFLARAVPVDGPYRHTEGNSDAHIKAAITGNCVTLPVVGGRLGLGTWQGVFLAEYDGPRRRRVMVHVEGAPEPGPMA